MVVVMLAMQPGVAVEPPPRSPQPLPADERPANVTRWAGLGLMGAGVGSLGVALGLHLVRGRILKHVALETVPGPTGFSAARWSDLAPGVRHSQRLRIGALTFVGVGAFAFVAGTATLIVGSVWRRNIRRDRVSLGPGGLLVRW